jgi:phosphoenolpyruvate carboxykinase (GTP)
MADLFAVDAASWLHEADLTAEYFTKFGDKVPAALYTQLDNIKTRLNQS